ncbi:hypothetical protein GCM10017691_16750 [Pseudonocardia petroleophila]|uniref:Restriction endonuclease type II-like domain-containing protein n=1 Tax=Pseudonocardia petroleophila TaxID=37331 RepID=A0A7G7MHJ7_9PSEU|nr:hypothetical protein [Pseudonocardia petroleophila]QNG52258.1 hypothetical protein H6H00_30185 [Pseudonocardia petroleophila]
MQPERDAQVRDQVVRLVGVLRALAPPARLPVRHVDAHDAVLWLEDLRCPVGNGPEVLRLRRSVAEPEPSAPAAVAGWLGPAGDDLEPPVLHDRGPLHGQHAYLVDAPGVRDAFDAWMAVRRPWAHRERARRAQEELVARVGELARLAALPGRELVLGAGLLHLPASGTHVHVLGQPVAVRTDPATGDLVCTVTGPLRWEDDRTPAPREPGPFALAPDVVDLLGGWAGPPCTLDPGWTRPTGPSPVLAVAPALLVRRTGAVALHRCWDEVDRSVRDVRRPVPLGLAQLVRAVAPAERAAWLQRSGAAAVLDEPLLPFAATEDQSRVVAALGADTGVVVEGPPGTGKTHTVAALLGALLADGKRVLVTSGDAGSLRVLRDRLPEGLRDLCVGLDDADGGGVARVARERTEFDPARADRRIADLTARRADAARTRDEVATRIGLLREAEARVYPEIAPGFGGTPAQVARTLLSTAERDGWVPGAVHGQPPVDDAEFAELLDLLREQTPRHRERRHRLPVPAPLSPEGFARLAGAVDRGPFVHPGPDDELVVALGELPPEALTALEALAGEIAESAAALRALPDPTGWTRTTADALLASGPSRTWHEALAELDAVDAAVEHARRVAAPVEVAPDVDEPAAAHALERLAEHLGQGAALKRVFRSAEQRAVERLGTAVLVDGVPPRTRAAAVTAVHHLAVRRIAHRVDAAFAPLRTGIPDGPHSVDALLDLRRACGVVERLHAVVGAVGRVLVELPPPARPALGSVADLERVGCLAALARAHRAARLARAEVDAAVALVEAVPPAQRMPEHAPLLDALRALDPAGYTAAGHALDTARREHRAQTRADELLDRVRGAAPELAAQLAAGFAPDPQRWGPAWARARAVAWMAQQPAATAGAAADAELAVATGVLRSLTSELGVARAWRACLTRIDTTQAQALQAYRHAVTQARAGTGEAAEALRRSARDAMAVALSAVPAWVLPVPALLETLAHRPDSFDVVIVDEATRLDPSCAFLLWLAPRVVVVGDDGQCVPPAAPAPPLVETALPDVPGYLRAALGPGSSLFSVLRTRFGPVVRLRDQFRGLPAITDWSPDPGRDDPPAPLRRAVADGTPALRSTFVRGDEVQAVVEAVAACVAEHPDRSVGVVVPGDDPGFGPAVADRLAPAVRARVRVGTPEDFRGDERDAVVLPLHPASAQDYALAVSRARDRLWLVHTVRAADLPPGDVRRSLLEHVLAGADDLPPVPSGVRADRRDDRFDSLFEQAVFLDLVGRGFHVLPQVTVNGRRIDLVVTGAGGTVAVECDGEAFHTTPEQRAADLAREQELTGCGWTFVRVRESVHLLDPDAALAPVWAALEERGIAPLGEVVDGVWTPRPVETEVLEVVAAPRPPVDAVATAELPAPGPAPEPQTAAMAVPSTTASPVARPPVAVPPPAPPVLPGPEVPAVPVSAPGVRDAATVRVPVHHAAAPDAGWPEPDVTVRMPGPRVSADGAEPRPSGRHALREVPAREVPAREAPAAAGQVDAVEELFGVGEADLERSAGAAVSGAGSGSVPVGPSVAEPSVAEPSVAEPSVVEPSVVEPPVIEPPGVRSPVGPPPPAPQVVDPPPVGSPVVGSGEPSFVGPGEVLPVSGPRSAEQPPGEPSPVGGDVVEPMTAGSWSAWETPPVEREPVEIHPAGPGPDRPVDLFAEPPSRPGPDPVDLSAEPPHRYRPVEGVEPAELFAETPARPRTPDPESRPHRAEPEEPRPAAPTAAQRAALLDVARSRPLTVAAVRNLLGVGPDVALHLLGTLTGEGALEQRGADRTTHWVPAPREDLVAEFQRRRADLRRRSRLSSAG